MDGLETLSEAIDRLTKAGYTLSLRAKGGQLSATKGPLGDAPEAFQVDTIVRLEGITDLDEESAVFALTHKASGQKGLYVVAYGPEMHSDDLAIVQKLSDY
jgi:hypothetical protein